MSWKGSPQVRAAGSTSAAGGADPVASRRAADTPALTQTGSSSLQVDTGPVDTGPVDAGPVDARPVDSGGAGAAAGEAPSLSIGVLALQGAVREHLATLDRLGLRAVEVRHPEDLARVDALIIPGGESTAISMLIDSAGLREPLQERLDGGMPAFGTCAGMILLAKDVADGRPDQHFFAAIDIEVRRNAFGRQVDSFETDLALGGLDAPLHAVFIRAPVVERVGPGVEVLATVDGFDGGPRPVVCRQGPVLVAAFHPELTTDTRLHTLFVSTVVKSKGMGASAPAAGGQDDGAGEAATGAPDELGPPGLQEPRGSMRKEG